MVLGELVASVLKSTGRDVFLYRGDLRMRVSAVYDGEPLVGDEAGGAQDEPGEAERSCQGPHGSP